MLRTEGIITEGNLYDIVQRVGDPPRAAEPAGACAVSIGTSITSCGNDKIVLIDEFTGRMMEGRRFSEGLHQALEAKEGVTVQPENQTLASITFQNYFRHLPEALGHDRARR